MSEENFMQQAITLAQAGVSWTNPNPLVGAVLVKNNVVISKGFHKEYGGPHAEVNAIEASTENTKGSTLFVNLQPCSSHGNTPPCTNAIIKAGIKKVVYASDDPSQKSISILSKAGVEVTGGVLKKEADFLNRKFLYFTENNLPYVTIKFAASLDGKMATKTHDSKWITNDQARKFARSLRGENQAILAGSTTILEDNPHLGSRDKKLKDPIRIVLDTMLKTLPSAKVYRDSNVVIFTGSKAPKGKIKKFQDKNITVHQFNSSKIEISEVLKHLAKQKIISILVEGGGKVIGSFIDSGPVNEVYGFYAPIIVGGRNAPGIDIEGVEKINKALKIKNPEFKQFDNNFLIHGLL